MSSSADSFRPNPSTLVDAVRAMAVDPDESATFSRVVAVALEEIPADFGGISELIKNDIRTRAASDPRVVDLDRAQYNSGEGPCVMAAEASPPIVVCGDLPADQRWPEFGRVASQIGVSSVLSFKLFDGQVTIGALNLYALEPHAFGAESQGIGSLLAAHAAIVMTASRKQASLNLALETRDIIGQAKGILMERYKFNDRQAFDALIAVSQHTHRKLRDIADQLCTTGQLPGID